MRASMLPVYREKRLSFNPNLKRSPSSLHWIGRLPYSALGRGIYRLWRACTTTPDGSLSDTFKLFANDDTDAHTSASGGSRFVPKEVADGSFLDVVVVDHEEHPETKPLARDKAESSGPGSTVLGTHEPEFFGLDDEPGQYQGGFWSWIQYRGWPEVVDFFEPKFTEHEEEYQRQIWHARKGLVFCASLFLVLNWVLYLILNNESTKNSLYGKIVFWGGLTLFTLPTPVMVALDMPRRSAVLFQTWFCIAVWYCAFAEIVQMRQCHFFTDNHCSGKTFLAISYYLTGLPGLMMFVISKRLYNFIAQIVSFILLAVLILPVQGVYARNVVSFAVFSIFIQGLQYSSENDRRRLYLLAMQLQQASKAKHKARMAESKASFTKRRFANYIFHEVRVPLNTAFIALQLLQSGNALKEEFTKGTEIYALELGLKMMKTVLNDVLDFESSLSFGSYPSIDAFPTDRNGLRPFRDHRESIHIFPCPIIFSLTNTFQPFPLHRSIRSILDQVAVQAKARNIVLERSLDERIDAVPLSPVSKTEETEGLWVVGSELRLQQVLTNLAVNAVKYTPEAAGPVRISTEFLGISTRDELPGTAPNIGDMSTDRNSMGTLTHSHAPPRPQTSNTQTQCLNFRLVVHDSGPGMKTSDLVEDRLFQPFAQTVLGRASGSGTGLGLAIVKQIVRLSGGRLGVTSRRGEGSKFWVELSYPIASAEEIKAVRDANNLTALPRPEGHHDKVFTDGPPIAPAFTDRLLEPTTPQLIDPARIDSLTLPVPPEFESLPPPQAPPPTDPLLVLVVDDDALTRLLSSKSVFLSSLNTFPVAADRRPTVRLLTKLGCVVQIAKDGRECLDLVLSKPPHAYDMICLDNFMPVTTGEEAVRELREHGRDDFVVGCTGNALTEDQDSYREAGVDEVMVKPVMIHDFKQMIQLAHHRRQERRRKVP
ncbi:hypothetical protein B0H16DRAFT_1891390 [Mycena metata]|uniref:histidine kinase n=1 Tax=Mycena metata TaxID=1033252 RepID=A0AAD7IBZ3_9AGAR|nr:hypothetical protein B0H16DRAFT_1891390 [Mycena metata]